MEYGYLIVGEVGFSLCHKRFRCRTLLETYRLSNKRLAHQQFRFHLNHLPKTGYLIVRVAWGSWFFQWWSYRVLEFRVLVVVRWFLYCDFELGRLLRGTFQELEEFFSQPPYAFSTIFHSLKLKYRALTIEPSIIEKTMSPYQLYASGSPLWTSELTAEEADAVLKHTVGTCTLTEDEFNDRYQKALNGELTKKPFHLVMGW